MLSDADLDLIARERSLPGLSSVLDRDAFAELLRHTAPELAQAIVRPTYVRFKPGARCLVTYELGAGESRSFVHASAYAAWLWADKVIRGGGGDDAPERTARILAHDRAVVITLFPEDARLRALGRLVEPVGRVSFLRKIVPEYRALHSASLETLAYNPERRYVGLLAGEGALAVIKLYSDDVFARARAAAGAARESDVVRTPRCIGRSRRHRALALEWLPGQPLAALLTTRAGVDEHMWRAGRALAELHRRLRRGMSGGRPHEPQSLFRAAREIHALWPAFGDRADRLASALSGALEYPAASQPIHGDFYAAQVIVDAGAVGILDFDRSCLGDPATDVGNFAAHLEYGAIEGRLPPKVKDSAIEAFISGYENSAGRLGTRVAAHVAARLFLLGSRPFRTRAADWPDRMSAILDRAESLLPSRPRLRPSFPPRHQSITIAAANDRDLALPEQALDAESAAAHFARLPRWRAVTVTVSGVRVVHHKPGRRCLIEYDVECGNTDGASTRVTVIGKVRRKGADCETFELTRTLWQRGFNPDDRSGIDVPEPIGVLPELKLWLQLKVAGSPAATVIGACPAPELGRRAAEVVHKLQLANVRPRRSHTSDDELGLLRERLSAVASQRPRWKGRLETLVDACSTQLASLSCVPPCGVHRDFHPGQLMVDGERLHLLDLDLYAAGDPALDIGNFLAHVTECRLRGVGDSRALRAFEAAMIDRFIELAPSVNRHRVQVYRLVSLARHVYISTQFPDRQAFTERILDYCEDQLAHPATKPRRHRRDI